MGGKINSGYGRFRFCGKLELSHRVAYRLSVGEIPDGMFVCHKCDNPSCCKPSHLFLGTHTDNIQDAVKKGRMTGGRKLNWDAVLDIREMFAAGHSKQMMADKYEVDVTTVSNILSGKTWKGVPPRNYKRLGRKESFH
jgi:hypothetical protein